MYLCMITYKKIFSDYYLISETRCFPLLTKPIDGSICYCLDIYSHYNHDLRTYNIVYMYICL